jgi:hypothetical protein
MGYTFPLTNIFQRDWNHEPVKKIVNSLLRFRLISIKTTYLFYGSKNRSDSTLLPPWFSSQPWAGCRNTWRDVDRTSWLKCVTCLCRLLAQKKHQLDESGKLKPDKLESSLSLSIFGGQTRKIHGFLETFLSTNWLITSSSFLFWGKPSEGWESRTTKQLWLRTITGCMGSCAVVVAFMWLFMAMYRCTRGYMVTYWFWTGSNTTNRRPTLKTSGDFISVLRLKK